MRNKIAFISLLIATLTMAPSAGARDESTDVGKRHALVLSRISDNPKKHYRSLKPMADYLAEQLSKVGVKEGRVLMAKDVDQMVRYFKEGRVDVINDTVSIGARLMDEGVAEPLLKAQRKGEAQYRTVIFVRKDSGIDSLAGLRGRAIAFEDPGSTSAYTIPAAVLIGAGLDLVRLDSPRTPVPSNRIGYVFSGEEINSTIMVHKRVVAAAAFSNMDWISERAMPSNIRNELKIIHETANFPRALILVRRGLDPAVKDRLKQVLLQTGEDPQGTLLLPHYHDTTQFDLITEADIAGIEEARRLGAIVRDRLE